MRTPSARYEEARKLISSLYNVSVATYHYNGRHDIVKCASTGECGVCNLPLSYIVRFREKTVSLRCKNVTCHVPNKVFSFDGTEVAPRVENNRRPRLRAVLDLTAEARRAEAVEI